MSFGKYIICLALALCVLLSLDSCRRSDEGKVIPKQKMSQVLADVYLTDAMLKQIDSKTRHEWSRGLKNEYFQDISYHWILDKHQITEADFYASVSHYSRYTKTMIELLDMTEEHLDAKMKAVKERETMEAEAERLRLFNLKWQRVSIDEDFVHLWAKALMDVPASAASSVEDSLPAVSSDLDWWLDLSLDTFHLAQSDTLIVETGSLGISDSIFPKDSSVFESFVQQYFHYWQQADEDLRAIKAATAYQIFESADSHSVKTDSLSSDSLPADTLSVDESSAGGLPQLKLKGVKEKPSVISVDEGLRGRISGRLLQAPAELRTNDGSSR